MGKFDPYAVNFVIRDIDTGEVKEEFRTFTASRSYLKGMNFGLQHYFEIYDCKEKKVVFRTVKAEKGSGYTNIKEEEINDR